MKISYSPEEIQEVVIGRKYLACLLKNGNLGICATLDQTFPPGYSYGKDPDINSYCDRILLNAYFNAQLNYSREYAEDKDIFDFMSFDGYKNIVMIGYFVSLVKKFEEAKIALNIFDLKEDTPNIVPLEKQKQYIANADALIVTSTSVSNSSFPYLVGATSNRAEVFLLGPSTILDPDMYQYQNIKKIFGMVFTGNEEQVMKLIQEGHGTPSFSKFGHKVYLYNAL